MLQKLSPIMPARDIAKTEEFYAALGFRGAGMRELALIDLDGNLIRAGQDI